MRIYFAPMEGLTDSIYRRLHSKYFPGIDQYYTPFISPTIHRVLTPREERELPIEPGYAVVPQILTKVPEDFLWLTTVCADRGYTEVNLNLGCPSGTVTAKGKGSGMLQNLESLASFLDAVFSNTVLPISIKTRVGFSSSDTFPILLEVFNRYPIKELIIHPRIRSDFYSKPLDLEAWKYALNNSVNPVCFNGDICSASDCNTIHAEYPQVQSVMIGRGLIGNPGMFSSNDYTAHRISEFYNSLLDEYMVAFGGSRNAMFRLKESWRYMLCLFEDSKQLGKRLLKTTDVNEYRAITSSIFSDLTLRKELLPDWRP